MFQTKKIKQKSKNHKYLDTGPPLQARPNRTATILTQTNNTTNPSSFSGSRTRDRNGTFFLSLFFFCRPIDHQSILKTMTMKSL